MNRVLTTMLLLGLAACSVVPGLHVSPGSPGDKKAGYRVVEVDADVLARMMEDAQVRVPPLPDSIAGLTSGDVAALYRIGASDVVSVVVWDHPELTNPFGEFRDAVSAGLLVAADGTMFFPHVGTFPVQGKTVQEARAYLKEALSVVIRDPQVEVKVVAYRSQRVQVSGQVKDPGAVMIDDTAKGVLEAINERGGLTPDASRRQLILTRGAKSWRIDLSALLSGVDGAKNPLLMPGDKLHVPDADQDRIAVLGEVKTSAPVPIGQGGLHLTEALAAVGGLDRISSEDSGVLIFRRAQETRDAVPVVYVLDLGRAEGMLLANELPLAPRDVVYVKATDFAKYNAVINQLLPTISAVFQLDRLVND
jgi:polysaccharide export outer membrane protein